MSTTSLSNDIRKFVDNELLDFYLSEMKRLISEWVIGEDIIYEALHRVMSRDWDEEYKNLLDLFFIKPSNMFSVEWIIIMDDSDCRISRTIEQVYHDEKINLI